MVDMENDELVFLKLGGSLITDKSKPQTPRLPVLRRLIQEIKQAREARPNLKIILGHGSGSFGHMPASKYRTVRGVFTQKDRKGFLEVWHAARKLNELVLKECENAGLPMFNFPPSAGVITTKRSIIAWNIQPIQQAIQEGYIPLIFGDAILDTRLHGTILSTEELFNFLVKKMKPSRILLAGIEEGVFADFPKNSILIPDLSFKWYSRNKAQITSSIHADVTGGMAEKVRIMLRSVNNHRGLRVQIFNGLEKANVYRALLGERLGTTIQARELK
jgi:isopentenyl phosphate kinase